MLEAPRQPYRETRLEPRVRLLVYTIKSPRKASPSFVSDLHKCCAVKRASGSTERMDETRAEIKAGTEVIEEMRREEVK